MISIVILPSADTVYYVQHKSSRLRMDSGNRYQAFLLPLKGPGYNFNRQGRVTPIGAVSRAVTGVKMQSNGQGTFWRSVKQSISVLDPTLCISSKLGGQEAWPRCCACAVS